MALINSDLTWFKQGEILNGAPSTGARINQGNLNSVFGELLANDSGLDQRLNSFESAMTPGTNSITTGSLFSTNIQVSNISSLNSSSSMENFFTAGRKINSVFIDSDFANVGDIKVTNLILSNPSSANNGISLFDVEGKISESYLPAQEEDTSNIFDYLFDKKSHSQKFKESLSLSGSVWNGDFFANKFIFEDGTRITRSFYVLIVVDLINHNPSTDLIEDIFEERNFSLYQWTYRYGEERFEKIFGDDMYFVTIDNFLINDANNNKTPKLEISVVPGNSSSSGNIDVVWWVK